MSTFKTADDFLAAVYLAKPASWRKGQAAFNGLLQVRPDLAELVRGGILDPFHDDNRLPDFEVWLRARWQE